MDMIDFSNVPEYAKSQGYSIFHFDGCPSPYVFAPSKGLFFSPSNNLGQDKLQMQILEWRWIAENRYGHSRQLYLDILFIDDRNYISILSLNRESAKAASEYLKQFSQVDRDIFPYAAQTILSSSVRTIDIDAKSKEYSVVDRFQFSWVDKGRFSDAATWMAECRPENPWLLVGVEG